MSIRSYFKSKHSLPGPQGSSSTCLPMQVIALANKVVEKAVMDNGLGKKRGQYFIYMVASDAASSFILFDVTQSLVLLE